MGRCSWNGDDWVGVDIWESFEAVAGNTLGTAAGTVTRSLDDLRVGVERVLEADSPTRRPKDSLNATLDTAAYG